MYSQKTPSLTDSGITQLFKELGLFLNKDHSLYIDSRKVTPGSIFAAYPGTLVDGRDYIAKAIASGAEVILWEPGIEFDYSITNFPIKNLVQYIGIIAAEIYGNPSKDMQVFAVTGTNGKTSVSHWLNQAYHFLDKKSAIIGTTGAGVYPDVVDYASTTPDPTVLQKLLNQFKCSQVEVIAMEVSSHALDQGRVNGTQINTAIFTNLTQDHLDYHKTMENYFNAKEKLFYWHGLKHTVINSDDEYGKRIIDLFEKNNSQVKMISYGIKSGDLQARDIELSLTGTRFILTYQGQEQIITAPLIGRFNIYNLLAVFAALIVNEISWTSLALIAKALKPVVGRMDAVILADKPLVVVDYSHTPDALKNALITLREIQEAGKLICVFGCGGNRDSSKRSQMGEIAAILADQVIITTDNPRFEDPQAIIDEIIEGMPSNLNYKVIIDRKDAITSAIAMASHRDVVLVAGKGHETYQEIQGVKHHFSDLELVKELLA